ncbi:Laminin alpha [Chamberlinius hualienensis]
MIANCDMKYLFIFSFIISINAEEPKLVNDVLLDLSRWADISTTSTCGVRRMEYYCIVSNTGNEQGHECSLCDASKPSLSHNITNAIDGKDTWWKSENNPGKVIINVDLKQKFFVTSVLIKMGPTAKPAIWSVERSIDGQTFSPWIYFVSRPTYCNSFGIKPNMPIRQINDVICQYSSVNFIEFEEVVVDLIKGRLGSLASKFNGALQNWAMATNVRLVFYKLQTFLGELIYNDSSVTRTHFYTIRDIVISGRCVCHGHDKGCDINQETGKMECQCDHNTCGRHCEECCPGYHQYHWQPQIGVRPTGSVSCQACNCHGHSTDCYFNKTVADLKLSLDINRQYRGGGVCVGCLHNTGGINCERCGDGFYRNAGVSPLDTKNCKACNCNNYGSFSNVCKHIGGRCSCKPFVHGRQCAMCLPNYWGFPNCKPCKCSRIGSLGTVCDRVTGQCKCKTGMIGLKCDQCKDAANSIRTSSGCIACHNCSMDLLNATRLWLDDVNSILTYIDLNPPADSWVHVRLRWIENQTKIQAQSYNLIQHQSAEILSKEDYLRNSAAEINYLLKRMIVEDILTAIKSLQGKGELAVNTIHDIENRISEVLKVIDTSAETADVGFCMLNSTINSIKKKCLNSCQKYVESTAKHLKKEIFSRRMGGVYKLALKELQLIQSLNNRPIMLETNRCRVTEFHIWLNKVNKRLMRSYRDYTLLIHNSTLIKNLINYESISFVKETLIAIESGIQELNKSLKLKQEMKRLKTEMAKRLSEFFAIFNYVNESPAKLKTKVNGFVRYLRLLRNVKNQTINVAMECEKRTIRIVNEARNIKSIVEPYNRILEESNQIPSVISESLTNAKEIKFPMLQIDTAVKYLNEQLSRFIFKPDEMSILVPFKLNSRSFIIEEDEDYVEASGYHTDDIEGLNPSLKVGLSTLKDLLKNDASISDLKYKTLAKTNDVKTIRIMLNIKNETIERNRVVLDTLYYDGGELKSINTFRKNHLSIWTKFQGKTKRTIALVDQVKRRIRNQNYDNCKSTENLIDGRQPLYQLKFKVDYATSLVESLTKKVVELKRSKWPIDFLNQIYLIKNLIETAKNRLASIQVPLSFQMFSHVLLTVPNNVLIKSCFTSFEFWFFSLNPDGFLLSIGDMSSSTTSITVYLRSYHLVFVIHQKNLFKLLEIVYPLNLNHWYCVELNWADYNVNVLVRNHNLRIPVAASVKLDRSEIHDFEPIVYIGGLPENMEIDAKYSRHFTGCLGGLKINNHIVNIFAWQSSIGSISTCGSSPSDETRKLESLTFDGDGGLKIRPHRSSVSTFPLVDFNLQTVQRNCVLASFTDTNQKELLTVKLVNGHIVVQFEKKDYSKCLNLHSTNKYNDGKIHHITLLPLGNKVVTGGQLTVDKLDRVSGTCTSSSIKTIINLGSVQNPLKSSFEVLEPSFIGCMHDMKINNKSVIQVGKSPFRLDFTMVSCPANFGGCMCLTRNSNGPIKIPMLRFRIATLSLVFSLNFDLQHNLNSTILHYSPTPYSWLEVTLVTNNVLIKWQVGSNEGPLLAGEKMLLKNVSMNSAWHSLLIRNHLAEVNNCSLINVDGQYADLPVALFTDIGFAAHHLVYLGGTPYNRLKSNNTSSSVCYRDFLINDRLQDFSIYSIPNGLEICSRH